MTEAFLLTLTDADGNDAVITLLVPVNVDVAAEEQLLPGLRGIIDGADPTGNAVDYYLEVAEDHAGVLFTLPVTDADGDAITHVITGAWDIDGQAVAGLFVIDAATGEVRLADGMSLDHEMLTGYTITVTSTSTSVPPSDAAGFAPRAPQSLTQVVALKVVDVNEAPTEILTDGNADRAANPLVIDLPDGTIDAEGVQVAVLTVTDEDDDRFEEQNWGAITGDDAGQFRNPHG